MNNVNVNQNRQEHWWLAWAGLFVLCYPLTKFLYAVMDAFHPMSSTMIPSELFAANMALFWTFLGWQAQKQAKSAVTVDSGRRSRRWSQKAAFSISFLFVTVVGSITKLCMGHPSWRFILISAAAIPLSTFIANFLVTV